MPSSGVQTCALDRKSTRLNSSHGSISYAVFCLKKTPATRRRLSRSESRQWLLRTHRTCSTAIARSAARIGDRVSSLARRSVFFCLFFFNDTATTEIYTLSLHDALPISPNKIIWDNKFLQDACKMAH